MHPSPRIFQMRTVYEDKDKRGPVSLTLSPSPASPTRARGQPRCSVTANTDGSNTGRAAAGGLERNKPEGAPAWA